MSMYRILYNPQAGSGKGKEETERLVARLSEDTVLYDMTTIADYAVFLASLPAADKLLIAGGDGTLNRFLNDTKDIPLTHSVWYYPVGSGNDFWRDVAEAGRDLPLCIDEYLHDLPTVEVNGESYRVLNGVGFGIDGYCCEEGDRLRAAGSKAINYTAIAIKGLLFAFRPVNATVTVDGVTHSFRKVWLAPTMHGRYYGGGMMPAPAQDRTSPARTVSTMIMYGAGKLRTLMIFPSIFNGGHVKHTKSVSVLTGKDITVIFDRPTSLQIDGETHLGVTSCRIRAAASLPAEEKSELCAAR